MEEILKKMFSVQDTISELLSNKITVHSLFLKDTDIPLINLDWGATNRPLTYVENKISENIFQLYGNPNSCGTLTGKTSKDVIDKTTDMIFGDLGLSDVTHGVIYGGEGSTHWFEHVAREIINQGSSIDCITLQEELHRSLLDPWLNKNGVKMHYNRDLLWLERFIRYANLYTRERQIVILLSLSSHLTGYSLDVEFDTLRELLSNSESLTPPMVIVDATCYLAHHLRLPRDLNFDFMAFSGHKFPGGPGSCGCLIFNKEHSSLINPRGTPNVLGIAKLGFATRARTTIMKEVEKNIQVDFLIRDLESFFETTHRSNTRFQLHRWDKSRGRKSEPVFTFSVLLTDLNLYIHPQVVSMILLNAFGIQIRAGGQCADYVIEKGGLWEAIRMVGEKNEIYQPSVCRISLPRYLISEEVVNDIKEKLSEFLSVARYMIKTFQPTLDGWMIDDQYRMYVDHHFDKEIQKTGENRTCRPCQKQKEALLYSHKKVEQKDVPGGFDIYTQMNISILNKIGKFSSSASSDEIFGHPFRWFVHPRDED